MSTSLRVVSYNILYGGQDRLEKIAAVLRALEADIVGLQEANEPAHVARLAEQLGMAHFVARSRNSPFHVALMSRFPIENPENLCNRCPHLWRSALRATVPAGGAPLRVIVLHLAPGMRADREAVRQGELDELWPVLHAPEEAGRPALMMGDFNSTAPWHPHVSDGLRPAYSGARIPREVIQRIRDAGWTDAVHRARPDDGTHSVSVASPTTRVDFIWLSPALSDRLLDARVEALEIAREASDHYPVRAILRPVAAAPNGTAPR